MNIKDFFIKLKYRIFCERRKHIRCINDSVKRSEVKAFENNKRYLGLLKRLKEKGLVMKGEQVSLKGD